MQKIIDIYNVRTKKPIDNRYVCNNLSDIDMPYEGLKTFQISDNKFYKYVGGAFAEDINDLTLVNNSILAVTNRINNFAILNVKDFGAKGDGTTDDTTAILNAINTAVAGQVVFFPIGTYIISQTITLTKPIKLMGSDKLYEIEENSEKQTILKFTSSILKGFVVADVYSIHFANMSILMTNNTINALAGISLEGVHGGYCRNCSIENVVIWMGGQYGNGIYGTNVMTLNLNNVYCWQGAYGFYIEGAINTSITFYKTWAVDTCKGGYYLKNACYCSFISAICDSVNGIDYPFTFVGSNTITMVGCGSEQCKKSYFLIDSSTQINITGHFGSYANGGGSGSNSESYALIQNGSKDITFIGCRDNNAIAMNVSTSLTVDNTSVAPLSLNCNFAKGITINGVHYDDISGSSESTRMNIGVANIIDNPAGTGVMLISNRGVATKAQEIGVLADGMTGWLGSIMSDGTFFVGTLGVLPSATSAYRGRMARVEGGAGIADHIYLCIKNASDVYFWQQII